MLGVYIHPVLRWHLRTGRGAAAPGDLPRHYISFVNICGRAGFCLRWPVMRQMCAWYVPSRFKHQGKGCIWRKQERKTKKASQKAFSAFCKEVIHTECNNDAWLTLGWWECVCLCYLCYVTVLYLLVYPKDTSDNFSLMLIWNYLPVLRWTH